MLERIFRKRVAFLLLAAVLFGLGVVLVSQLPVQLYPQTQRPRVRVRLEHAGYSAVDFQVQYGRQVEAQFLAVDNVDLLEVRYGNDASNFTLTFNWQADAEQAKADVESAMNTVSAFLPEDIRDNYSVRFFTGENAGYLLVGVRSDTVPPEEIYRTLKNALEPKLKQVDDVELIEIYNVEELAVEVTLRPEDMLAYGLSISDIDTAMRTGHLPEPVGTLEEQDREYTVRYLKGVDSIYDVGRIEVAKRGNLSVRLEDVADVSIGYALPRLTFVIQGQPAVRVTATPVDGGNIRKMSEQVQQILRDARRSGVLPADAQILPYLDPAEYINRSIRNVVQAALLGAALAMLVVLLTLGELRNTVLIGISLPVSLVLSFILMYAFGVSLNLISLGGIALAVGMVIDSSIVVMENIHRHRFDAGLIGDNRSLRQLIVGAVRQVRAPVVASTLTSVLVFLPISFTAPLTNAILGDQAKTVVFALLISLAVALTLIPMLASVLYRVRPRPAVPAGGGPPAAGGAGAAERSGGFSRAVARVTALFVGAYRASLRGLLSRRWASVLFMLFSAGLLAFALLRVLPLIPKEIISPPSSDRIVVFFRSVQEMENEEVVKNVVPQMDRMVREEVGQYITSTYAEVRGHFNRLFVNLKRARDADLVMARLQRLFASDNNYYYNVMMWDPAQLPLPRTMDLQIAVQGDDEQQAVAILERVRDLVNETDLYGWAFTEPGTALSDELAMTARPGIIEGFHGFTTASLVSLVRRTLRGTTPVDFDYEQETVSVAAQYPDAAVQGRDRLENFLIPSEVGVVPLKHFFDFQEKTGVAGISTENGEKIFRLYAKMPPGTAAANRELYEKRVREVLSRKLQLPAGYSVIFENPQKELDDAIRSLFVALAASVVLIYLLLAFQFNSLRVPLVVLVTVPLGFIGVVFSLYVFKSTLSLNSMLGSILLAGIVVNNAIIMIDFYLHAAPHHDSRIEALVETAGLRFRPMLITTLTTIFGMLPLAIGMQEGANIVQPLGIAVSGGLLISTLFTLYMVPCILSFMKVRRAEE